MKKTIIKSGAIITNDKKELLIVSKYGSDIFITPGGRIEASETKEGALKRELKEELQVEVTNSEFFNTYTMDSATHDPDCSLVLHLYMVKISGNIKPSNEIEKAIWLSRNDYKINKYKLSKMFEQFIPDLEDKRII